MLRKTACFWSVILVTVVARVGAVTLASSFQYVKGPNRMFNRLERRHEDSGRRHRRSLQESRSRSQQNAAWLPLLRSLQTDDAAATDDESVGPIFVCADQCFGEVDNEYGNQCTCTETSQVFDTIPIPLANGTDPEEVEWFVDSHILYNNSCFSECEACFDDNGDGATDYCGHFDSKLSRGLDTAVVTSLLSSPITIDNANASFASYRNGLIETVMSCLRYSQGETGTICLTTTEYRYADEERGTCSITYNGVPCQSCDPGDHDGSYCLKADCSNVDPSFSSTIDECTKAGLESGGPLRFLLYELDDSVEVSVGATPGCGTGATGNTGGTVPTSTTAPGPPAMANPSAPATAATGTAPTPKVTTTTDSKPSTPSGPPTSAAAGTPAYLSVRVGLLLSLLAATIM
jgi:hypothetical protein